MKAKIVVAIVVLVAMMGMSVRATEYTWTGAVDSDFFNELNWEDGAGFSPAAGTIDPDPVSINHDLVIPSGTPEVQMAS